MVAGDPSGHGSVGLYGCGIHGLEYDHMKNDDHRGGGSALVEKASSGYGVVPFWEGMNDRSPGFVTSSD